jgi:hypothetical protein
MNLAGMFYGVLNEVLAGKGHCGVRGVRDVVSSPKSPQSKTTLPTYPEHQTLLLRKRERPVNTPRKPQNK